MEVDVNHCFWRSLACGAVLAISPAFAGTQTLTDGLRWLTVASTKDLDTAKGIAGYYGWKQVKVMQANNGWYAVALGPFAATTKAELLKLEPYLTDLPSDALFSKGEAYGDVVWQSEAITEDDTGPLTPYSPGHDVEFTSGSITFKVQMTGNEDKPGATVITGFEQGKLLFTFSVGEEFSTLDAGAGLIKLDAASEQPQLVVTRNSGGAHCCTMTWIATKPKGSAGWTLVTANQLDGGGYAFSDLDNNGAMELLNRDNQFFYAFDSYVDSNAPTRISQLLGTTLVDTTIDPHWSHEKRQDLAQMEFSAKVTPEQWTANGFLAGWVAQKIMLGEGEAAWAKMLKSHNTDPDFGPMECSIDKSEADCPDHLLQKVPFERALAKFLRDANYAPLPKAAEALLKE
jgi:serine protease Do